MNFLTNIIKRCYRSNFSLVKAENTVWTDLKNYHDSAEWRSGIYESDRFIRTYFEIENGRTGEYYYSVHDGFIYARTRVLLNYDSDFTNDIYVLASHFNNLLSFGKVIIDPESKVVEYQLRRSVWIPLLNYSEIEEQMYRHFTTSEDVRWAFERLLEIGDNPSFIMADVLKRHDNKN